MFGNGDQLGQLDLHRSSEMSNWLIVFLLSFVYDFLVALFSYAAFKAASVLINSIVGRQALHDDLWDATH